MKSKMLDEQIIMKGKNENILSPEHEKWMLWSKREKKTECRIKKTGDKMNQSKEKKTSGLCRKFFF
jgi:hypothetical protein